MKIRLEVGEDVYVRGQVVDIFASKECVVYGVEIAGNRFIAPDSEVQKFEPDDSGRVDGSYYDKNNDVMVSKAFVNVHKNIARRELVDYILEEIEQGDYRTGAKVISANELASLLQKFKPKEE